MAEPARLRYGLLGRTLGHSWSPQIHAQLGSAPYSLIEREPDEAEGFLREGAWHGLNVTIPYKRLAAEVADQCSSRVRRLGVANTLVRQSDGTIFAENTDVLGFAWLLSRFARRELGQSAAEAFGMGDALILGSGGACQAVRAAIEDSTDCRACVISRTGEDSYDGIVERHPHARLIVNTTPVGMYPHCPASPLDDQTLAAFTELRAVIDVVYNPERTGICLAAERLGLPYESGLAMLVAQAFYASELFQGARLDDSLIDQIEQRLRASQRNIVLIGMPGAGKTSTGRSLAHLLGRPFIDLDDAFAVEYGVSAGDYITAHGEPAFRAEETKIAARYGSQSGLVIACGGGVVTQERNYDLLHQNGSIAFIDRPLYQLTSNGRPLSQLKGIQRLAEERMDRYRGWSDVAILCTGSASGDAVLLRARLGL